MEKEVKLNMTQLNPVKNAFYRKFQYKSYKENDNKAKEAIVKHLKLNGHTILNTEENYSFDIHSKKDEVMHYSEVEMKNQWVGEWNPLWKEIRIPHRKIKLVNKFRKLNNGEGIFNFYIIRNDCKYAWKINESQMTQDSIKEIWLSNAKRNEHFFHIPYTEAELIDIKVN